MKFIVIETYQKTTYGYSDSTKETYINLDQISAVIPSDGWIGMNTPGLGFKATPEGIKKVLANIYG